MPDPDQAAVPTDAELADLLGWAEDRLRKVNAIDMLTARAPLYDKLVAALKELQATRRVTADRDRLREALKQISYQTDGDWTQKLARRALETETKDG